MDPTPSYGFWGFLLTHGAHKLTHACIHIYNTLNEINQGCGTIKKTMNIFK